MDLKRGAAPQVLSPHWEGGMHPGGSLALFSEGKGLAGGFGMSGAKGESPFGTREWVSTRELADVYGQTVDFWQKLAKAGAFESKRNGLGTRAHLSINVQSFLRYWNSCETGAASCPKETISGSSKGTASGTRARGAKAKNG